MRITWLAISLAVYGHAQAANNDTYFWGPYRPNLYFGLRPRAPQSLMTGLLWFGTHNYQSISRLRHACEQGDELQGYTWTEYDPKDGGVQVIKDPLNNIKITTEFLKVPGGEHGGSWATRVKGEPLDKTRRSRVSLVFYAGLEGFGSLDMETDEDENGLDGDVVLRGSSPDLDDFTLRIIDDIENEPITTGPMASKFTERIGKTHFLGRHMEQGKVWTARETILENIISHASPILKEYQDPKASPPDPAFTLQLSDETYSNSNLYAIQKFFEGSFQFDVLYDSGSSNQKLDSATLDKGIQTFIQSFDQRFAAAFPTPEDYPTEDREGLIKFSKAITSNLAAGVGYFHGNSIVDPSFSYEWDEENLADSDDHEEKKGAQMTEPMSLLTATPSRPFFPRGFYWDEGFHLLHIGQWDNDFSLEILQSWVNLINEDGWVAREQILGEEARSKVPQEFQTQVPNFANPPTLTMALTAFIERLNAQGGGVSDQDLGLDFGMGDQVPLSDEDPSSPGSRYLQDHTLAQEYLRSLYGPLKRHYDWFRKTQRGQIKQFGRKAHSKTEAYRWRGRSATHVLTSGMDDYPRGPPHTGELHVDLISWMAFFSRTMRGIAEFIGEVEDATTYAEIERDVARNIDDLHWSDEENMYCDANVDDEDDSYHVCHKGYLSLFPLFLEILPHDSPKVDAILDMIADPAHLWSPYGIRSLSASHPEFGQGENYWKGPVWVQMNYLVLRALHQTYAKTPGPYQAKAQRIYEDLRHNIVDNTFKEYQRTGYVWEQYDSSTGEGRRSHPFTGWTSLVTLILSEKY
ncbi:glycoside hydrolase [Pterulicium gracile]|uniref:Mannosyl-oligosaccharide glucosidase n=1 Tax=Pterulicium gracile TaxID=1884261 RepID=A0A5C3QYD2_9AGAR|nr:glycoside hydrolase [Pterula gracilis]